MPDEYFTRTQATPARVRSGPSLRAVLGLGLLAFLGGAVLVGYLVWAGQINLTASATTPQPALASFATPTPAASQAVAVGGFDQRIAALEQRLARVDLQSAAAEGNTARAEAMLVAFAARRSIERGVELGYLGEQLRMRFGAAQPKAVETVIAAAKAPVTLDGLSSELDSLAPELSTAPSGEGGWDRFKRELSGLFVIRRGDTPRAARKTAWPAPACCCAPAGSTMQPTRWPRCRAARRPRPGSPRPTPMPKPSARST